ncbi:acetyl-CoA C-acetyltransferase [Psychrobacter sp. FDAARGOS_221]|uniref:acetyl-CoA C-acetyltransferase n=1 Tax=Psychrobacter sp. FDAARGOS_221 TaxID=1975705 RepID=UPI001D0D54F1|nr:acetyl-CoA C-acetyltransferase [Psychrobacter sp. FDAARGOS_221]
MSNSKKTNNKSAESKTTITSTVVNKAGESLLDENRSEQSNAAETSADFSKLQKEVNASEKSEADAVISEDRAAKQKIIAESKAQAEQDDNLSAVDSDDSQKDEASESKASDNQPSDNKPAEKSEKKEAAAAKSKDTDNKSDAKKADKTDSDNKTTTTQADNAKTNSNTNNKETSMSNSSNLPRRVAILGGNRIPFARSNGAYADASNTDMLSAALNGLVERYELQGERVGEVVAGAVLKLSRDLNLTRESALNTALDPQTPAYDISQACGTGLQATFASANKIALGIIDSAITGGVDTTSDAPIAVGDGLRKALIKLGAARNNKQRLSALTSINPKELIDAPQNGEPRTGLSMGEHQAITALEWNITREAQDELAVNSHHNLARAYEEGFFDDMITPFKGLTRDNNLRPDSSLEKLATLKPVFGKNNANPTMTAANSTPLTDGASCVLLGTDEWAKEHGLKPLAYIAHQETAAVDFIGKNGPKEGLLMAPAYAVPRMLERAGLTLQDFDFYEIHEAFASQVLSTLAAWEDETFCKERLGLDAPLGSIDRSKLNVNGSSLAAGHPFAATGGRILATAAKLLDQKGSGRALISICAAGGQGVTCILEK